MWRRILQPDVLFLIGTLQGLLPYLLFALEGYPPGYSFELSYYPMAIWIIGYVFFWIGTRIKIGSIRSGVTRTVPVSFSVLKGSLACLLFIGGVELIGLIKLYGGIPLLAFANGQFDVNDANDIQAQSGFGQVGAAALTVYMLIGLITLIAIKGQKEQVRVARWITPSLLFTLFMSAFSGKRQGLLMIFMIIACCSTVTFGSPTQLLSSFVPIKVKNRGNTIVAALAIILLLQSLSALVALRTLGNDKQSTLEGLTLYYEWPIMNMSEQSSQGVGFGPYQFKPLAVISSLLPTKASLGTSFVSEVPRIERSSPSGFYENLQWDTGLWGIIPFCIVCGAFSNYIYKLAYSRYWALLTYSLMAWALFSAPLYNHFLNLLFLPLPAMIFFAASFTVRTMHRAAN